MDGIENELGTVCYVHDQPFYALTMNFLNRVKISFVSLTVLNTLTGFLSMVLPSDTALPIVFDNTRLTRLAILVLLATLALLRTGLSILPGQVQRLGRLLHDCFLSTSLSQSVFPLGLRVLFEDVDSRVIFHSIIIMKALNTSTILFKFSVSKQLNYYRVLDLDPGSATHAVKARYYELAKKYHPDANTDPQMAKKFIAISEAYKTLGDSRRKKIYDDSFDFKNNDQQLYRHKNKKQSSKRENQYSDPFNQHDQFFKKTTRIKPQRGDDIYEKTKITLQEAVRGVVKNLLLTRKHICPDCDPTSAPKCFACGGKGRVHIYSSRANSPCTRCNSKGYKNDCGTCKGLQFITQTCGQQMVVPKGVHDGTVLRKEGSGGYGVRNKNGDLYVKVEIQKDNYYKIDGNNIRTVNYIPISVAVLGGNVSVDTLHGIVEVKIQSGTQSGDQKRLPNYGLPSSYSKRMGDQIVSFRVSIPKTLRKEERTIFQSLSSIN